MVCSANLNTIKTCLLWCKSIVAGNSAALWGLWWRKKNMAKEQNGKKCIFNCVTDKWFSHQEKKKIIIGELFSHTGWRGHEQHRSFTNCQMRWWWWSLKKEKSGWLLKHASTFKIAPLTLSNTHSPHSKSHWVCFSALSWVFNGPLCPLEPSGNH